MNNTRITQHPKGTPSRCKTCNRVIPPPRVRLGGRFCSSHCRREASRLAYRGRNPKPETPKGIAASRNLLCVALDLAKCGYEVFIPLVSPFPSSLVAFKGGKFVLLKIASAKRSANGSVIFSKRMKNRPGILVLVFPDGSIEYHPKLVDGTLGQIEQKRNP